MLSTFRRSSRIYLSSLIGTLAVFLSGLSSLVIIGKVSVQNLLEKQKDQVSKCSPQGKIVLACTALPVSLLVTIFKIGRLAMMHPGARATVVFVGHALSGSSSLVWHIAIPERLTEIPSHVSVNKSDPTFLEWRSETADRLQTASACLLQLGLFTFVLAICFSLYQDRLVTTILPKFPLKTSQENISTDKGGRTRGD